MLLSQLLRHVVNRYRSFRAPRASCRCPLATIQMLGEHPYSCSRNHTDKRLFTVGPVPAHQVDGVAMPWAWLPAPELNPKWVAPSSDLARRWCDLSDLGDGSVIGRYWPADELLAQAWRSPAGWTWNLRPIPAAGQWDRFGELAVLAFGDQADLPDVFDAVAKAIADLPARSR